MSLFSFTKPLTLEDLKDIDSGRIQRSKDLRIKKVDQYLVTDKPDTLLGTIYRKFLEVIAKKPFEVLSKVLKYEIVNTKNNNSHIVIIKVPMHVDEKKLMKQKVKIYCDCSDFMYRCAWVLNNHNNLFLNSRIKDALGIAISTQPMKVKPTVACKHAYAAIEDLIKNYRQYLIVK